MSIFKIYKLLFLSPLHISDQHEEQNVSMKTIQSDTLQAAFVSCLAKTGTSIPADGDLGFVASSLFPYYQETKDSVPVFFLPMPLQTTVPANLDSNIEKKVKKIKWVDIALYDKILFGEDLFSLPSDCRPAIQGSYLTSHHLPSIEDGIREFVVSEVSQRVKIEDRTGRQEALPYYVDKITFKDFSGLYFLVIGDTTLIDKAINILCEEGLGTDRNVGFGRFTWSSSEITIDHPTESDYQVSLSTYIPETQEELHDMLESDTVAYDFYRRGGWITDYPFNTYRKNAIYAFMPGSVFKSSGKDYAGKIVNLNPFSDTKQLPHPIWRNGQSIMLPIKRN